jgi:ABC-type multidrug transport system ATPase subunit
MLEIKNINKTYANGVHALKDVNLTIPVGMFGLLGPNGAGKSSLIRTLSSLQQPDSGQVVFDGIDIFKHPQLLRSKLGYLPQDFGVYPKMSAYKLLEHFAVLKGIHNAAQRKKQIIQLLALTNLTAVKDKSVDTFSGGMLRRFGIAQALLGDPQLIIVDEPTAGLDPEERNRFHLLLCRLAESKVIILSTHIVEDINDLCKELAVLVAGEIKTQGKPEALIKYISGSVWQKAIAVNEESTLHEKYDVISTRLVKGQLVVRVLSCIKPDTEFTAVQANLEDVYFSVLHFPNSPCLVHCSNGQLDLTSGCQ